MRALANKFGAHLTFRHGESTGSIDLKAKQNPQPNSRRRDRMATPIDAARAIANFNRAYWRCCCGCTAGAGRPEPRRKNG
jgi:hypothetical protein